MTVKTTLEQLEIFSKTRGLYDTWDDEKICEFADYVSSDLHHYNEKWKKALSEIVAVQCPCPVCGIARKAIGNNGSPILDGEGYQR